MKYRAKKKLYLMRRIIPSGEEFEWNGEPGKNMEPIEDAKQKQATAQPDAHGSGGQVEGRAEEGGEKVRPSGSAGRAVQQQEEEAMNGSRRAGTAKRPKGNTSAE